jgi:DNA-binding winged helix-turn-helix (wHTH) protein
MPFFFEDQVLDPVRRELSREGQPIMVEPKVFDLLIYLVENRERLVTKDDLIAGVWGGRIVSDSALTSAINAARTAIGDNGRSQRLIRTSARKGFRFVGAVSMLDVQGRRNSADGAPLAQHADHGRARAEVLAMPESGSQATLSGATDCVTARDVSERRQLTGLASGSPADDLLEGIDIRDDAFEDWLREVRMAKAATAVPKPTSPQRKPEIIRSLQIQVSRSFSDSRSANASLIADMLVDYLVAESMTLGFVSISDERTGQDAPPSQEGLEAAALRLGARALDTEAGTLVHVTIVNHRNLRILWQAHATLKPNDIGPHNIQCGEIANRFIDLIIRLASGVLDTKPVDSALISAARVMKGLFAPSSVAMPEMERAVERAVDMAPCGAFFALRGTVNLLKFAERFGSTRVQAADAIRHDMARALESSPQNGLVHALMGHAEGNFFANHAASLEMTTEAITLAPASAISWTLHALALSRSGMDKEAHIASSRALRIGHTSFFRPFIEGACCICASNRGEIDRAIKHGEFATRFNPGFGSNLRYLFAAYAHAGRMRDAEAIYKQWLTLEPDLSLRLLRSGDYPIAVKRSLEFITAGAEKFGL